MLAAVAAGLVEPAVGVVARFVAVVGLVDSSVGSVAGLVAVADASSYELRTV